MRKTSEKIIASVAAFAITLVTLPIIPFVLAALIWNECDDGFER